MSQKQALPNPIRSDKSVNKEKMNHLSPRVLFNSVLGRATEHTDSYGLSQAIGGTDKGDSGGKGLGEEFTQKRGGIATQKDVTEGEDHSKGTGKKWICKSPGQWQKVGVEGRTVSGNKGREQGGIKE